MKSLYSLIFLCCTVFPVQAAIEAYQFEDAATEASYKELIKELRCLVCQNQNLADSDADLAKDLRQQTYEMLIQGKSREQIVAYMVQRYGDFVLYRPPVKSSTLMLWAGPFALLLLVLVIVVLRIKKTRSIDAPEENSLNQAKQLLEEGQNNPETDK